MTTEKPWLKNYPSGIPANINVDKYGSLVEMFDNVFKKYKDMPAFTCMGSTITFAELDKKSKLFGAFLLQRGLEKGDKIALMMPNLLQYPIALFGALRAGIVVVNTNPLYTPREMEHQFTDAEVKAIVIAENFAHNLEKIISKTKIKTVVVTSIGEMHGFFKKRMVNFAVRTLKRMVPAYNLPNAVKFCAAIKEGKKFDYEIHNGTPDEVILLQYTGGTTGVSKGAMLTNRNLVANMEQIQAWMMPFMTKPNQVALSPLPMYHIFAFTVNCLALMSVGTHTVLVTNARDIGSIIKEFNRHKVTLFTGVNTLYNALLNHDDFAGCDFSALNITVGGGMAVQTAVAKKWKEVTNCNLAEGFGMTETSPVVTVNPLDETLRLGTIGLPLPSTDMRIVNDDGQPIGVGEIGEIQVQGPQVMKGYYNRPDETAKTITADGWLNTGDIGKMAEDGFFSIVDRKKDMILVSGFNVFPNEVEDVIAHHPKVLEVAAIGVPSDKSGEVVKVFIVKKDNSLGESEIIDYCRENLTGYKVPKHVEFRDDLPKSNVGKILRRILKDQEV
jgi:long-chain acyl-CoA synthetase